MFLRFDLIDSVFIALNELCFIIFLKDLYTLKALWATNTFGTDARFLKMNSDGFLALVNDKQETVWMLNYGNNDISKCYLKLQDDSNLVLYGLSKSQSKYIPIWASGTFKEKTIYNKNDTVLI
jgi:hypothetical protein